MIAKCPNLYVVETVGSRKVADMLDKSIAQESKPPLQVHIVLMVLLDALLADGL